MQQTKVEQHRETYWDTVKAVLIFLVILGHSVQFLQYGTEMNKDFWADPLFKAIYIFHMPLFMLISGYFAAKSCIRHSWRVIPRYLQRLALPCLGSGLIWITLFVIKGNFSIGTTYGALTSLWFLIVLFECFLCYLLLNRKSSWWYKLTVMLPLPIIVGLLISRTPFITYLWPHSYHFTYMWPFFLLGSILYTKGFRHTTINRTWGLFLPAFIVAFLAFQPHWYVYRTILQFSLKSFGIDIIRTICALVGCGLFLWFVKLISFIGKYKIVQQVGQATLALYVLQSFFFSGSKIVISIIPTELNWLGCILTSVIILLSLFVFYKITVIIPGVSLLLYGESIPSSHTKITKKHLI